MKLCAWFSSLRTRSSSSLLSSLSSLRSPGRVGRRKTPELSRIRRSPATIIISPALSTPERVLFLLFSLRSLSHQASFSSSFLPQITQRIIRKAEGGTPTVTGDGVTRLGGRRGGGGGEGVCGERGFWGVRE